MNSPRIDKLLNHVDSNYAAVIVASKRARQINSYNNHLEEGFYDDIVPPMVDTGDRNNISTAFEEIAAGKIEYDYRD